MTRKFTHLSKNPQVISIISLSLALRFNEKETIGKLTEEGYNFSRQTFYKIKRKLKNNLVDRVNDVYNFEMLEEHFTAITAIKLGQRLLWQASTQEPDPLKRSEIIISVLNTYPFLTQYYKSVKQVMAQHKSIQIHKNTIPI